MASPQPCKRASEDVEGHGDADSDLSGDEGVDRARSGTDFDSDGEGSDAENEVRVRTKKRSLTLVWQQGINPKGRVIK